MKSWVAVVTTPSTDPDGVRIRRDVTGSLPIEGKPISTATAALAVGDKVLVLIQGHSLVVLGKAA